MNRCVSFIKLFNISESHFVLIFLKNTSVSTLRKMEQACMPLLLLLRKKIILDSIHKIRKRNKTNKKSKEKNKKTKR